VKKKNSEVILTISKVKFEHSYWSIHTQQWL